MASYKSESKKKPHPKTSLRINVFLVINVTIGDQIRDVVSP